MNCFNHNDIPSVATCIDCGKGLCRECASLYQMPVCNECNEKRSAEEKRAIYRQYIPSGIFFVIGIVLGFVMFPNSNILEAFLMGYLLSGVFWGWKVITFIQPKMFLFLPIFGWCIYFLIKVLLSYFVGLVAMPIGIARIIFRHRAANVKAKNIEVNKAATVTSPTI